MRYLGLGPQGFDQSGSDSLIPFSDPYLRRNQDNKGCCPTTCTMLGQRRQCCWPSTKPMLSKHLLFSGGDTVRCLWSGLVLRDVDTFILLSTDKQQ